MFSPSRLLLLDGSKSPTIADFSPKMKAPNEDIFYQIFLHHRHHSTIHFKLFLVSFNFPTFACNFSRDGTDYFL